MGLLDQYRYAGSEHPLEEAAAGSLIAVLECDGDVAPGEISTWKYLIYCHPLFRDMPPDTFNPMMERIHQRLDTTPWREALAGWARAIPEPLRPTVFTLAVDLVFADGVVTDNERTVVSHLQEVLGVSDQLAASVVSVMSIKCGLVLQQT